jgi:hypothetical protein
VVLCIRAAAGSSPIASSKRRAVRRTGARSNVETLVAVTLRLFSTTSVRDGGANQR